MAELVTVDDSALRVLGDDIAKFRRQLIGRLAERGYQLLRREVPKQTTNLQQGVAPPDVDYEVLEATLTVSARSGMTGARVAEVFGSDGKKTKTVTLRPQPAYNYAEVVARGNKKATMTPKTAKAFLIPVGSKPDTGGYLMVGGQIYVLRKSRRGQAANPFDVRAAEALQKEASSIADGVIARALLNA